MHTFRTTCTRDCLDSCSLLVFVENGILKKVKGDQNHPTTGGFLCPKGASYVDYVYSPDRIKRPLIKSQGRFKETSWNQALNYIEEKIRYCLKTYGPLSILHNHDGGSEALTKNLDRRFFNALGGCTGVSGSLCWSGGIAAQKYDFGGLQQNDIEDLVNASGIVLWGRNVGDTNTHVVPFIIEAQKRGAHIAVINPMRTSLNGKAELVIKPKPGTDAALALGAIRYLIKNRLYDEGFVKNYTLGFEKLALTAEEFTMERTATITGVNSEDIKALARFYAEGRAITTLLGFGLQRYRGGGNAIRAVDALSALTANIGKSGAGVSYGHQFHWHVSDYVAGEEMVKNRRLFDRTNLAREILEAHDPSIHLAFITRSNPMNMSPDTVLMREALNSIDTVVVIDLFMTDTANQADVVLPATSLFEEENIHLNSWSPWISYCPKVIQPLGEARSDQEIFLDLANRLNLKGFEHLNSENLLAWAVKPLVEFGITLEQLKRHPVSNPRIPKIAWEHKKFMTPSGKIELYSERAASDGHHPTAMYIPPECERDKLPYYFITPHSRYRINSQFQQLATIKAKNPHPVVYMHPEEAKAIGLKSGQMVEVYNKKQSIRARLCLEPRMRRDIVSLEAGWALSSGACANMLTSAVNTKMGQAAAFYDCKVGVRLCQG